jgi:hypothetical protein
MEFGAFGYWRIIIDMAGQQQWSVGYRLIREWAQIFVSGRI